MKNRVPNTILPVILLFGLFSCLEAQSVTATVNTNQLSTGETVTLTIKVSNSDKEPNVNINPLNKDFTIISGPGASTNISWVNGKMTSTKSVSWTMTPKRYGHLVIPSLPVKLGRRSYSTRPIPITVDSGPQQSQVSKELFLKATMDKSEAVVGEQVTVTYKLYTRVNLTIQNLKFPDYVGFWTEDLFVPKTADFRDAAIGGVAYKVATLYTVALFPTKTGKIDLPPMTVRCSVPVRQKRSRNNFFNDPFFNSMDPFGKQSAAKTLATEPLELNVKPYTSPQPSGFTGAVGHFSVQTSVDTTQVSVNDGLTFRILLSGEGNLPLISNPELHFPPNIEVYPPKTEVKKDPFRDRISGTVKWEYILIPREAGKLVLPRVDIPYYDLSSKSWKKASAKSISLTVYPGKDVTTVSGDFTKKEVTLLGKDIRYIHTDTPKWISSGKSSIPGRAVTFYVLALALWVSPGLLKRSRENLAATRQSRMAKKALRTAYHQLGKATGSPFEFVPPLVYQYLKDRFEHHTDKLDPLAVKAMLNPLNKSDITDRLVELLQICDAGKYSPEAVSLKESLVDEVKALLREIDGLAA